MNKLSILTIMKFCDRNSFLAMRLCSRRFCELSKLVNSQWFAILEEFGPRKITRKSVHVAYCNYVPKGRICKKVSHYDYNTLEVKLLKTVPLYEQVFRIFTRRFYNDALGHYIDASAELGAAEYKLEMRKKYERRLKKQVDFYRILYDKYNGGKRKKTKLNHDNLF